MAAKLSPPVHTDWSRDPRHNALVHGLTANFPLDDHEHQILAEEIDTWTREIGPTCEVESALIQAAAIARVRHVRAARAEAAAIRLARKQAAQKRQKTLAHRARKLAQDLPKNPSETVDQLESTAAGRAWLAARWRDLDRHLAQGLEISRNQRIQTMNMMGYIARPPGADAPMSARQLWANLFQAMSNSFRYAALGPPMNAITRAEILENFEPPPELPADAIEARRWLRDLCGSERIHLDQLDRQAIEDGDESASEEDEATLRAELSLVQIGDEARLRHRYGKEAESSLRSNTRLLMQIRRDRRQAEADERKEARHRPPREPAGWRGSSAAGSPLPPGEGARRAGEGPGATTGPDHDEHAAAASPETNGTAHEATPSPTTTYPFPAGNAERRTNPAPTDPEPPHAVHVPDAPANDPTPARPRKPHIDPDEPRSWSNPPSR